MTNEKTQAIYEFQKSVCDAVEKALAVMHNREFADKVTNEAEKASAEAAETPEQETKAFEMTPEEAIEELQDQMNGEIAEYGEENIGHTIKAYEMAIEALQERTTAQDATDAAETPEFHEGELIVYQNGDTFQIGEIKRLCEFAEGAFVYYHEGDTASLTPFENMHKLQNAYCIKQTSFALDRNAEE